MGLLAAGQVVIVHFPFSDLSQSKLRPAMVLAEAGRGDWLLCQITASLTAIHAQSKSSLPTLSKALCAPQAMCDPGSFSRRTRA